MQQATYNNAATGSVTPFISGSLATQGAIDDLAGGFIGTLGAILDELVDEATDELRDAANGDSDWREFAPYLRVDLQDGELSYGYDGNDNVSARIAGLEYGTLEDTPNPLIRMFAHENRLDFADSVTDRIEKELDFG